MKLKAIFLSSLVAGTLVLGSCGSSLRLLKNVYVGGISPVMIPMAASGDAYRSATSIREGYQSGAWTELVTFPVMFVWHAVKHVCYVGVHVADIALYPFYAASDLSKLGPDIMPIDYYGNTWVDKMHEAHTKEKLRDRTTVGVDSGTGERR